VIGMKALAGGKLPSDLQIPAELCRRFALSLPISTLVCGITSRKDLQQDLAVARGFQPLSADDMTAALNQSQPSSAEGKYEIYKTTRYGSDFHFKQHGE
jgi:predicted aldo/keto reductase-like oxidoreductase